MHLYRSELKNPEISSLTSPSASTFPGSSVHFGIFFILLLVLRLDASAGGKIHNLQILESIPGIEVPAWFWIPPEAFEEHLQMYGIDISRLDEDPTFAATIRKKIIESPIDGNLLSALGNDAVAVRSSAVMEDLESSSFAGLYDTELNQRGMGEVALAVKRVWASTFNDRVIAERKKRGISQRECQIAVIIQKMVPAKVSGVVTTIELSSGYEGIEIAANRGVGESVVGGTVTVDKWLVHKTRDYIIKSTCGSKEFKTVLLESGTGMQKCSPEERQTYVMDPATVLKVAAQAKKIKEHYQIDIDLEFAIDEMGKLFFLQARPLVKNEYDTCVVVDAEEAKSHAVLAKGMYSVPGVAVGTLKFISDWEDLVQQRIQIDPDDIVIAYVALNYWSHYLIQFKGLITKQGGPTTHPVLLARERGVPCLIGIDDAFDLLLSKDGEHVTLDGINRVIYEGEVKLQKATAASMQARFAPVVEELDKPINERIEELTKAGCLLFDEEKYWIRPSIHGGNFFVDIHLRAFERIPKLLGRPCKIETKVLDGRVCWRLLPADEERLLFEDMSLEECEEYMKRQEKNLNDYLQLTKNFIYTKENWERFKALFIDLRAYLYFGESFRRYVEKEINKIAASIELPRYFLEEYSAQIQETLDEEDLHMQEELFHLAAKNMPSVDEVFALAHRYRFEKNFSFEEGVDLAAVYYLLNHHPKPPCKKIPNRVDFFPEHRKLKRWLELSISSRVLQSNTHHLQLRGFWPVREALLEQMPWMNPSELFEHLYLAGHI